MAPGQYSWLTLSQAISQLGQRLNITPSTTSFWTIAELEIYLAQALRMFNCLTNTWKTDFTFTNTNAPPNVWNNLGTLPNSPRLRTITDTYCYTEMEYMLLEPPTGSAWSGTNQFNISVLSQALQRRRDEILQVSNCNQVLLQNIGLTPGTRRTILPDTTIDVARVRYLANQLAPVTLYRDDTVAQEFYEAGFWQAKPGVPQTFMLTSEPPLAWDVDIPPAFPGTYEAVVLQSGAPFAPPTPTLIGIPDDFAWVLEFGSLADLLGEESESTDRERADYALKRYQDGLLLLLNTPWIMLGKVNQQAVTVDSLRATDQYSVNWDSNPTGFGPAIITGGIDFFASPVGSSVGLTVLGNAPILDSTETYVQISRSDADIMFDLAQARATWKQGGAKWKAGLELEKRAIQACAAENSRLKSLGAFADIIIQRGQIQDFNQNRYNAKSAQRR